MKVKKNSWPALFPCPVVLVSCLNSNNVPNIITLAWTGTVCSDPPMIGLGIRPNRYSYSIIEETKEFVVNIPSINILKETDFCGVTSGKEINKFSKTGLTPSPAENVKAPLIKECPVNIECKTRYKYPIGMHHLFIGEIIKVHIDKDILDKNKKIDFNKIQTFVYNQGEYWSLSKKIGTHGFSIKVK